LAKADFREWVEQGAENEIFRKAVHIILHAISRREELREILVLKGGILLALNYESTRYTRDIDFSIEKKIEEVDVQEILGKLSQELVESVNELNYGTDCAIQGWEQNPPGGDVSFPTIRVRVGYAEFGNQRAHRRLAQKNAVHVIKLDLSLNEPRGDPELFELEDNNIIQIYSLHDLVAEKYRAILQQEIRNRTRRQDVYDLYLLISTIKKLQSKKTQFLIFKSLIIKARSRDVPLSKDSMENPQIIDRSKKQYGQLRDEIEGELPNFDEAYGLVKNYYENLNWEKLKLST